MSYNNTVNLGGVTFTYAQEDLRDLGSRRAIQVLSRIWELSMNSTGSDILDILPIYSILSIYSINSI